MQPNIKKNYLYRVFYEVLLLITPFITTPYVSRVLGADGVGDYSFTHSIITYFMLFGALGTASYGAREIARARDDKKLSSKLFWEIELMTVGTTGICLLVWIGVIIFGDKYRYIYLALTPFLFSIMFDISWYFTGLEKIKNIVIRNSIVRILGIILLFFFVKKKEDILIYCIINSCTVLFGSISMWLYLPNCLEKVDFHELHIRRHLKETMIYFIPSIATSVYTVLDKTLIGAITGSSYQNGYYEQATKVIKIVKSMVFVAVNSVMGARQSYLFAEKRIKEIKSRILKSLSFIYFLGYGALFGLISISKSFVPVFFGNGYEPVIILVSIMSPLIIIVGTSNCLGSQYYIPSGQRKRSSKVIILGSFLNLIFNLIMIPIWGAIGATIASIIAELVIAIIYVNICDGFIKWGDIWELSWKRIIAGIFMFLSLLLIEKVTILSGIPLVIIQVAVGIFIYIIILIFEKDEMTLYLLKLLRKRIIKKG